jgi:hypothetical protein
MDYRKIGEAMRYCMYSEVELPFVGGSARKFMSFLNSKDTNFNLKTLSA